MLRQYLLYKKADAMNSAYSGATVNSLPKDLDLKAERALASKLPEVRIPGEQLPQNPRPSPVPVKPYVGRDGVKVAPKAYNGHLFNAPATKAPSTPRPGPWRISPPNNPWGMTPVNAPVRSWSNPVTAVSQVDHGPNRFVETEGRNVRMSYSGQPKPGTERSMTNYMRRAMEGLKDSASPIVRSAAPVASEAGALARGVAKGSAFLTPFDLASRTDMDRLRNGSDDPTKLPQTWAGVHMAGMGDYWKKAPGRFADYMRNIGDNEVSPSDVLNPVGILNASWGKVGKPLADMVVGDARGTTPASPLTADDNRRINDYHYNRQMALNRRLLEGGAGVRGGVTASL